LALQCAGDDRLNPRILNRPRRTGSRFVAQSIDPLGKEPAAPLADCHGMHAEFAADGLVLVPLGAGEDDPCALRQRLRRLGT
jgi:hypothetical protein